MGQTNLINEPDLCQAQPKKGGHDTYFHLSDSFLDSYFLKGVHLIGNRYHVPLFPFLT